MRAAQPITIRPTIDLRTADTLIEWVYKQNAPAEVLDWIASLEESVAKKRASEHVRLLNYERHLEAKEREAKAALMHIRPPSAIPPNAVD